MTIAAIFAWLVASGLCAEARFQSPNGDVLVTVTCVRHEVLASAIDDEEEEAPAPAPQRGAQ